MARLFTSGFETGGTTDWTAVNSAGASVQTTTALFGSYSGRTNAMTSAAVSGWRYQFVGVNNNGPYYARAYLQVHTLPTAANFIMVLASSTFVNIIDFRLNSTGTLAFADNGGIIATTSEALRTDVPYLLEMMFDNRSGAGDGICRGRINSVEFATSTTSTFTSGVSYIRIGGNLNTEAQTQADWYWDNIAVNDTTGTTETSWPTDKLAVSLNNFQAIDAGDGMSVTEKIR